MSQDWSLLGLQAANLLPNLGVSIIVLLTVLFFEPRPHVFMTAVVLLGVSWDAWQNYKARLLPSWLDIVKAQFVVIGYVLVILYVSFFFGFWGVLGVILAGVVIGLIILWRQRKVYMSTLRSIEKLIWGKPLDEQEEKK